MTSVLRELPLSYAVLSKDRWYGSASAVHEPSPTARPYRASPVAPASAPTTPSRRSLTPPPRGSGYILSDRLLCVRYRYDAQRKKRFKIVELVVAERDWEPPRPRFPHDQIVAVQVAFADVAVRKLVKQAGGTWNPERKVWQLRYDRVVALGLNSRIVDVPASNSGCSRSSGENLHADAPASSR